MLLWVLGGFGDRGFVFLFAIGVLRFGSLGQLRYHAGVDSADRTQHLTPQPPCHSALNLSHGLLWAFLLSLQ